MADIIGRNNRLIKDLKDQIKKNNEDNEILTDDLSIINLAVKYKKEIKLFLYCLDRVKNDETIKLIDEIKKTCNNFYEINSQAFLKIAQKENSAGLFCIIKKDEYKLDDLKDKEFLIVLDHLEIPGNIGTIFRTCDSAKVDGIISVDSICKLNNIKITSSSRGTNILIPSIDEKYEDVQKWLIDNNYTIFLGEPELGLNYQQYNYSGKIAIVVGNERFGINKKWYDSPNKKVFIPMFGSNNSLNVGVAASILIYEARMKKNVL